MCYDSGLFVTFSYAAASFDQAGATCFPCLEMGSIDSDELSYSDADRLSKIVEWCNKKQEIYFKRNIKIDKISYYIPAKNNKNRLCCKRSDADAEV